MGDLSWKNQPEFFKFAVYNPTHCRPISTICFPFGLTLLCSITSRCSVNEPALLPPFPQRTGDQIQESSGNGAYNNFLFGVSVRCWTRLL